MENSGSGEITIHNNDERIIQVQGCLENNDIEAAKNILLEMLSQNPNNNQASFVFAQILETEGNYVEAANIYEKIFSQQVPMDFYERLLHVYEMADRYDNLYAIYKSRYSQNTDNIDLCERLANTCFILEKFEEAIELYNKILTLDSENIVALKQLVEIYENTNQMMFRLTLARLAELEGDFDKAEKEYKKAISSAENDDDVLQIRYKAAKLYRKIGKNEQALDEYSNILSLTKDNFAVLTELSEIYQDMNNLQAALDVLKRALNLYPDNLEVIKALADIYLEVEDFKKAEGYFEQLVKEDNKNIENCVSLAKVYLNLDKLDMTRDILNEAEKIEPNNTELLTAMAGYYTFVNDFDKAKSYCERIVQKLPQSPLGYRKLAQLYQAMGNQHLSHYNFAIYHELRNEKEDAIAEYSIAVNLQNNDYESIKKLAKLYFELCEFDEALDYLNMLFVANVELVETTKNIVTIYFKEQEYSLAQRYIQEALEKDADMELRYLNAKCEYLMKDYAAAFEDFTYYKENTKSLEHIEEVDKILEKIENKKTDSQGFWSKLFSIFK